MANTDFKTVDEYIGIFPEDVQKILQEIRQTIQETIQEAVPDAEEVISYQMPAFRLNGMLVWYAAWKKHIGLYPKTAGVEAAFQSELAGYEKSKGTIKFSLDKPVPFDLIGKISKYRAEENLR
ncbi:MAG: DUF1801 domain-containing protein [Balneolaceae bacterium]